MIMKALQQISPEIKLASFVALGKQLQQKLSSKSFFDTDDIKFAENIKCLETFLAIGKELWHTISQNIPKTGLALEINTLIESLFQIIQRMRENTLGSSSKILLNQFINASNNTAITSEDFPSYLFKNISVLLKVIQNPAILNDKMRDYDNRIQKGVMAQVPAAFLPVLEFICSAYPPNIDLKWFALVDKTLANACLRTEKIFENNADVKKLQETIMAKIAAKLTEIGMATDLVTTEADANGSRIIINDLRNILIKLQQRKVPLYYGSPVTYAGDSHDKMRWRVGVICQQDLENFGIIMTAIKERAYARALRRACTATDVSDIRIHQIVAIILEYKDILNININEQAGDKNFAAIHYAAEKGNKVVFDLLKKAGANITLQAKGGKTADDLLREYESKQSKVSAAEVVPQRK